MESDKRLTFGIPTAYRVGYARVIFLAGSITAANRVFAASAFCRTPVGKAWIVWAPTPAMPILGLSTAELLRVFAAVAARIEAAPGVRIVKTLVTRRAPTAPRVVRILTAERVWMLAAVVIRVLTADILRMLAAMVIRIYTTDISWIDAAEVVRVLTTEIVGVLTAKVSRIEAANIVWIYAARVLRIIEAGAPRSGRPAAHILRMLAAEHSWIQTAVVGGIVKAIRTRG